MKKQIEDQPPDFDTLCYSWAGIISSWQNLSLVHGEGRTLYIKAGNWPGSPGRCVPLFQA